MLTKKRILFQTFQWFDGLTMSGFILNCFAPFNALRRFKFKVQEFKLNFHVSRILETSKGSGKTS